MQIEFKQQDSVGIVQLIGDLNVVQVDPFRQKFKDWFMANPSTKNVVIDLKEVSMIDSAGLGVLIAILKQVRERGGDLKLAGMQKRVRLVFEITRTQRIFTITETVKDSVRSFE
ncbi:MAG: STAS domain-containing protein [Kiritimatiellia bacterium]